MVKREGSHSGGARFNARRRPIYVKYGRKKDIKKYKLLFAFYLELLVIYELIILAHTASS